MPSRALSRALAPRALPLAALLLVASTSIADAALRVRPWSPLHARLTEIARANGVSLDQVLAEPERWMAPDGKLASRAMPMPLASEGVADPPIRFTFPRTMGAPLEAPGAGDFDGDGVDDLAAFDPPAGRVALFEGDALHALDIRHDVTLESGDQLETVADLDGDGRADLVAGRASDGTIAWYRSTGGFAFDAPVRTTLGFEALRVVAAPMGGDARMDLVVLGADVLTTWLQQPGGTFAAGASVSGLGFAFGDPAIGDFDGDGRVDISFATWGGPLFSVRVLRNVSDAVLVPRPTILLDPGSSTIAITSADWNADGAEDLLTLAEDSVRVFPGVHGGDLASPISTPIDVSWGRVVARARLADVDRNGTLDLLVYARAGACYDGTCRRLLVLHGLGEGGFARPIRQMAYDSNPSVLGEPSELVLADFNGDRWPDTAVGTENNFPTVHVQFGDRRGAFLSPITEPLPFAPLLIRTARARRAATPTLLAWDGIATHHSTNLGPHRVESLVPLGEGEPLFTGDLDGDGLDDVVLVHGDSTTVWRASGTGGFTPVETLTGFVGFAVADVDAAQGPDLLCADGNADVFVRTNDGSGHFGPAVAFGVRIPPHARTLTAADLDRDGRSELLVGLNASYPDRDTLAIHRNLGSSFAAPTLHGIGFTREEFGTPNYAYPASISVGDLDGNGWPDPVVVLGVIADNLGGVSVVLNSNGQAFLPAADYLAGKDPREGLVVDFDRDGLDDVAIVLDMDSWDGALLVYRAGFGGVLTPMHQSAFLGLTAEHYPVTLAAGDWDSDDRVDLVAGNWVSRSLTFYRNLSPPGIPVATAASLVRAEAGPDGVALAWFASTGGFAASVERAFVGGAWSEVARVSADGTGHLAWLDRDVTPGARLGYRLSWSEAGSVRRSAETWVDVPRDAPLALAVHGAQPHPARGAPVLVFTLPVGDEATVELFDVSGRRVVERRLNAPAPGRHTVRLAGERSLAPGLYLARVAQAGRSVTARVIVTD